MKTIKKALSLLLVLVLVLGTLPASVYAVGPVEPDAGDLGPTQAGGAVTPPGATMPTEPAANVTGIVQGPDNQPLADAVVSVLIDDPESAAAMVTTDENGVFSLVLIPGATYTLGVYAGPAYETYSTAITPAEGDTVLDTICLPAARYTVKAGMTNGTILLNDTAFSEGQYPYGTSLTLRFQPITGYSVTAVTCNGQPAELDQDGCLQFPVEEDTEISVTAADVTAPEITDLTRTPESWSTSARYTFEVSDSGSEIDSVMLADAEDAEEGKILTPDENGIYTFTLSANATCYVIAADLAGNRAAVRIDETQVDTKAPVIEKAAPQTAWSADRCIVSVTVTDDGELASVAIEDGTGNTWPVESGKVTVYANGIYQVIAYDKAGNRADCNITVSNIDTEVPTAPALTKTPDSVWSNSDVTVTAVSTDTQSGISKYWYSTENTPFDPTTWQQIGKDGILTLTSEQDTDLYFRAEDGVGRISDASMIHVSIDKTAPGDLILSYDTGDTAFVKDLDGLLIFRDTVPFSASAKDSASGVVRYEYQLVPAGESISDTNWVSVSEGADGFRASVTASDTAGSIYVRAYDLAGNVTEPVTTKDYSIALENTPTDTQMQAPAPIISAATPEGTYTGDWTNQDVVLTISGSQAVSGIAGYEYRIDYTDPALEDTDWIGMNGTPANLTVSRDTNATFSFRAVTHAGNYSLEAEQTVLVQKTLPNAAVISPDAATGANGWYTVLPGYEIHYPSQARYGAPVRYEMTVTAPDGAVSEPVLCEEGKAAPAIVREGVWTLKLEARDAAGNVSSIADSTWTAYVDTSCPDSLTVSLGQQDFLSQGEGEAEWDQVWSVDQSGKISYNTFHNQAVHIDAGAAGGISGLEGIYYQKITGKNDSGDWARFPTSGLDFAPENRFFLRFKAVDRAGNETVFTSDGIILDGTAPEGAVFAPSLDLIAGTDHLSPQGIYNGDVTVQVAVLDPIVGDLEVSSGLGTVTYRVLCDGSVTDAGQLFPGTGTAQQGRDGTVSWTGSVMIQAAKNDSNNVELQVTAADRAGNTRTTSLPLQIDVTPPSITASYSENSSANQFQGESIFTRQRTLTVTVTERNFNPAASGLVVRDTDTGKTMPVNWVSDGLSHTAVIPVTEDGHYTVSASVTDAAGNNTSSISFAEGTEAPDKWILDRTAPTISVSYDNNSAANGHYFAAPRTATITVTERNFDPARISASIRFTDHAGTSTLIPVRWASSGNVHTATIELADEGEYEVTVSGADGAGNAAEPAVYSGKASRYFVIDRHIDTPRISCVADGGAYAGSLVPEITVQDANLESIHASLYRTRLNEGSKDVTELLGDQDAAFIDTPDGKKAVLDIFPMDQAYDGIYTLVVTCRDLAGNESESSITFSCNRFGSVYVYDDYLHSLLGQSVQSVSSNLTIREYNPSGVLPDSVLIQILRNGEPITDPVYTISTPSATPGASGWFEYTYTIPSENFLEDGMYRVILSTKDGAGNIPENTGDDWAISFAVDTTPPELTSILGLERAIYKADAITVTLTAMDNISLESILVCLDGETLSQWTNLEDYSAEVSFDVPAGLEEHIRIVVTDKAGNTLDTDKDFKPGYAFHDTVTVSTNFFLRWYANKPLFICSILAVVAAAGAALAALLRRKRCKAKS